MYVEIYDTTYRMTVGFFDEDDSSNSSDDDDFNLQQPRRYSVHDCCEFEDSESLRRLIFKKKTWSDSSDSSDSSSEEKRINGSNENEAETVVTDVIKKEIKVTNTEISNETDVSKVNTEIKEEVTDKKNTESLKEKNKEEYYCPYDIDERDDDENTPIHIAIHCRKLEHVSLLLKAGANVHRKSEGSGPVHVAISIGSLKAHVEFAYKCLLLLKENGADLSLKDESLQTPLYLCAQNDLADCARICLQDSKGIQTLNHRADRVGGRPLHACAKFNSLQVIHVLLKIPDIEIDAMNNYGRTPLHLAASKGNWGIVRLLIQAGANTKVMDRRGILPGKLATIRGIAIPNDLRGCLGESSRDLLLDPDSNTLLIYHELCNRHKSCPPIKRGSMNDPPPENTRRLHVLIDEQVGILHSKEFESCTLEKEARRASMADVLKVHEYSYVEKITQLCMTIPDHDAAIASLDADTAVSHHSLEAAMRAAGAVCEAVDKIMAGDYRNAFCAVRPPGHHAGPRGIVPCVNDPNGSHGFCLLNNVAIGAAYARSLYRNDGICKIAIIDFDVHHGNGTEEIIRSLIPNLETSRISTQFVSGVLQTSNYRPWLNEDDIQNVFFASTHGYGPRENFPLSQQGGWFYPASGKTLITEAIQDGSFTKMNVQEFLLTQTWTRMGQDARTNCCKIIDVGLQLPQPNDIAGQQRIQVRDSYRNKVLPHLMQFNPDFIFISAGFDGHKRDSMNFGYCGMIEDDYEWITNELVKVANTCCQGRIVSVLEGGYKIHGGIVSPFARSVASHVRALVDAGSTRELYQESTWESQFEHTLIEEKERRRQSKLDKLRSLDEKEDIHADSLNRKRRRSQVDYRQLHEQMKKESLAS